MTRSHSLARWLLGTAATLSLLIGAAPAQAAVIAIFDPAFGPDLPHLGFRGTITFDVGSGCAGATGYQLTAAGACQVTVESARIDFYNADGVDTSTLTSVPLPGTFFSTSYVTGGYFDPTSGSLTGVDTQDSDVFNVDVSDTNAPAFDYDVNMVLYFVSDRNPIILDRAGFSPDAAVGPAPAFGGAFLRYCTDSTEGNDCIGSTSNRAAITFSDVPEPASIALGMIGLAALVASRRRRPAVVAG